MVWRETDTGKFSFDLCSAKPLSREKIEGSVCVGVGGCERQKAPSHAKVSITPTSHWIWKMNIKSFVYILQIRTMHCKKMKPMSKMGIMILISFLKCSEISWWKGQYKSYKIVRSLQLLFSKPLSFCCIFIKISVERLQFTTTTLLFYKWGWKRTFFEGLQKYAHITWGCIYRAVAGVTQLSVFAPV